MKFRFVATILLGLVMSSCAPSFADPVSTTPPVTRVDVVGEMPNASQTPGDVRTTDTSVVCDKSHSTREIRNVSGFLKQKVFDSYGLKAKRDGYCNTEQGCEVDHLISLELGGSNDIKNLWPEPYQGTIWNAHAKDKLENEAHKRVCAGRITLTDAQSKISKDWKVFYIEVFGADPKPE